MLNPTAPLPLRDPSLFRQACCVDGKWIEAASGKTLWQRKGLLAEGQYQEREEPAGRKQAIDRIVSSVIEGAQSQW